MKWKKPHHSKKGKYIMKCFGSSLILSLQISVKNKQTNKQKTDQLVKLGLKSKGNCQFRWVHHMRSILNRIINYFYPYNLPQKQLLFSACVPVLNRLVHVTVYYTFKENPNLQILVQDSCSKSAKQTVTTPLKKSQAWTIWQAYFMAVLLMHVPSCTEIWLALLNTHQKHLEKSIDVETTPVPLSLPELTSR